jgi:predicted RNA binding protein YcfA (HicA-like mRNA interferase family)
MPKLPAIKPREAITALEKAGFHSTRQRGSHLRLKKGNLSVTVPMHSGDLSQAVLHSILRQARLSPDEFLKLL